MTRPAIPPQLRLLALLVTPAWLVGCSPTATYGTGESPEMALFREVTGGLLSTEREEPIEYQPRAPLVLPPSTEQLPPPAEAAAAAAPDWPVDPSRRTASAPDLDEDLRYGEAQAEYRRLRPLAGAFPQGSADDPSESPYAIVHNKRQREEFRKALADSKGYGRTERRFLTDPPSEYRQPAATAPSEFEDINSGGGGGGGVSWWRRMFGG